MSYLNHYIGFSFNIKDKNLEFLDFKSQLVHGVKTKVFRALFKLDHCLFCHSERIKRNSHAHVNVKYLNDDASLPVVIHLFKKVLSVKNVVNPP